MPARIHIVATPFDEASVASFKKHTALLHREGLATFYSRKSRATFQEGDIILLMVSHACLKDVSVRHREQMADTHRFHENGGAVWVVLLSSVDLGTLDEFKWIESLPRFPRARGVTSQGYLYKVSLKGYPITLWRDPDSAWTQVSKELWIRLSKTAPKPTWHAHILKDDVF